MDLNTVANIAITLATTFPTQAGFGIPLLMASLTLTPNLTEEYFKIEDVEDEGYTSSHPVHQMATVAFSQNPRPTKIVVGKRTNKPTMVVKLTPLNTTEGFVYAFTVVASTGAEVEVEYTVQNGDTDDDIAAELASQIDPAADLTAAAASEVVTITGSTAGKLFDLRSLPNLADLKVEETTADPGIAADLAAVAEADPDSWYVVFLDSNSKAQAVAAAAWVESRRKLAGYNTTDSACADNAVTTDVLSTLKASGYKRAVTMFTANRIRSYACLGWISKLLAMSGTRPGSVNWAYQEIAAVTVDTRKNLTNGQESKILAKNGNTYTVLGGQNDTFWGKTSSGIFADLMHGRDWLHARMQEIVKGAFHNASNTGTKVPYTQKGLDYVGGLLQTILNIGVKNNFLVGTPTVTVPKIEDILAADRAERHAPGYAFSAKVAGAMNSIDASGVLEV